MSPRRQRLFRYEAYWNLDADNIEVIKNSWQRGVDGEHSLMTTRLMHSRCQQALSVWSSSKYGDVSRKIKYLTNRLERLQRWEHAGNGDQIEQLQSEINDLLEMEDIKWKQRAKQNWLRNGNRNTKFYHPWATQGRKSNLIE